MLYSDELKLFVQAMLKINKKIAYLGYIVSKLRLFTKKNVVAK